MLQCWGRLPETEIYLVQDMLTVTILLRGSPASAKPRRSSWLAGTLTRMQGFRRPSWDDHIPTVLSFREHYPGALNSFLYFL